MAMSVSSDGVVKIINCLVDNIDKMKRLLISVAVLIMAGYVTIRPEGVDPTNAGMWIGFASAVVSTYIGSKTVSQLIQSQQGTQQEQTE